MKRLVLSSGKVNRYGYRIIPEGIKIDNYLKNPVLLSFHNSNALPVGRLSDLKIENGQLTAALEFDEKDTEAMRLKQKYEDGFMKACSIYHIPTKFSDDSSLLLPGQTGLTVTETELVEVSLVSIGSDPDAQALSLSGKALEIPLIQNSKISNQMTSEEIKLRSKLGLAADATMDQILTRVDELTAEKNNALAARVDALMEAGKANGFLTDENIDSYRKLAAKDYDTVKDMISLHKKTETNDPEQQLSVKDILDAMKGSAAGTQDEDKETFAYLQKHDPKKLNHIRINEPEKYKALAEAYAK